MKLIIQIKINFEFNVIYLHSAFRRTNAVCKQVKNYNVINWTYPFWIPISSFVHKVLFFVYVVVGVVVFDSLIKHIFASIILETHNRLWNYLFVNNTRIPNLVWWLLGGDWAGMGLSTEVTLSPWGGRRTSRLESCRAHLRKISRYML